MQSDEPTLQFCRHKHLWAAFKTRLSKHLANAANPFLFITNMSQGYF